MTSKILNEGPERTVAVVFNSGEEVSHGLLKVAEDLNLSAARLSGIGALSRVVFGFFNFEARQYREIEFNEQVEVLSFIGNIAIEGPEKKIHAHVVVAKSDGTAHGGHFLKGWVRPTMEILLVESPGFLAREMDPATGLPLIKIAPD